MKNDNKELQNAVNTIAKQIVIALKSSINNVYDRTFISVVKRVNTNGTYVVIDEFNVERTCVIAIPNVTLVVGERVYVTIPQGDISKMYISGIHPQIINR